MPLLADQDFFEPSLDEALFPEEMDDLFPTADDSMPLFPSLPEEPQPAMASGGLALEFVAAAAVVDMPLFQPLTPGSEGGDELSSYFSPMMPATVQTPAVPQGIAQLSPANSMVSLGEGEEEEEEGMFFASFTAGGQQQQQQQQQTQMHAADTTQLLAGNAAAIVAATFQNQLQQHLSSQSLGAGGASTTGELLPDAYGLYGSGASSSPSLPDLSWSPEAPDSPVEDIVLLDEIPGNPIAESLAWSQLPAAISPVNTAVALQTGGMLEDGPMNQSLPQLEALAQPLSVSHVAAANVTTIADDFSDDDDDDGDGDDGGAHHTNHHTQSEVTPLSTYTTIQNTATPDAGAWAGYQPIDAASPVEHQPSMLRPRPRPQPQIRSQSLNLERRRNVNAPVVARTASTLLMPKLDITAAPMDTAFNVSMIGTIQRKISAALVASPLSGCQQELPSLGSAIFTNEAANISRVYL
ncbi:hypothetical protein THASP1DRAFT_27648 [Thamnocephalis sphaerospora]|uniref:Uncharacterized protein n=1 Tax=Thamnocephalis sphaerospora TaxID=78915 RepID=A0A4P9XW56_9FUNG|nr:hypothetical protein THASP1DRAFT_27648 [Thamnocephalis sphaerospora]|eukprot:RKP10555.1 hypothetical protein THASP1DRAFT_27648 [Thamnocephalis sphaerospora]